MGKDHIFAKDKLRITHGLRTDYGLTSYRLLYGAQTFYYGLPC